MNTRRLIEIAGPTGAGKTTLLDALQKDSRLSEQKTMLANDLLKEIKPNGFLFPNLDLFAGRRFRKANPNFQRYFDLVHKELFRNDSFFIKGKRSIQLYESLCKYEMLGTHYLSHNEERICLIDEGLVFKSFSRIDITSQLQSIQNLADSFPLPGGIIYCKAPAETIAERAFNRKKTAPIHLGLSQDQITENIKIQLERADEWLSILKSRGLRTYCLDMDEELPATLDEFWKIIQKFKADIAG